MAVRYSLTSIVLSILEDYGGTMDYGKLLEKLLDRLDGRSFLRVFRHPSGRLWSPELNEAIKTLLYAGLIDFDNDKLRLRKYIKG